MKRVLSEDFREVIQLDQMGFVLRIHPAIVKSQGADTPEIYDTNELMHGVGIFVSHEDRCYRVNPRADDAQLLRKNIKPTP